MFTLNMDGIAWLAALAAVGVVVHLALAALLYRSASSLEGRWGRGTGEHSNVAAERPTRPLQTVDAHVTCPACGAPNDPFYRFCRGCVSDLSRAKNGGGRPEANG